MIKQTWSFHLIALVLNQERCHIPRLGGFSEDIVPQLNNKQFLRYFRVSPENVFIVLNSIIHSLDDNPWPGGSEPILPEKQLLIFLWYIANQESLREVGNTFAVGVTTVHEIVARVSTAVNDNLINASISLVQAPFQPFKYYYYFYHNYNYLHKLIENTNLTTFVMI